MNDQDTLEDLIEHAEGHLRDGPMNAENADHERGFYEGQLSVLRMVKNRRIAEASRIERAARMRAALKQILGWREIGNADTPREKLEAIEDIARTALRGEERVHEKPDDYYGLWVFIGFVLGVLAGSAGLIYQNWGCFS